MPVTQYPAGRGWCRDPVGGRDAGVNADLRVPVRVSDDLLFAVICVDDLDEARRVLGVQVISQDDFVL
jgi:hypothetical protein